MSWLKKFFIKDDAKKERGLADVLLNWRWGEQKPLDQKKLLELVEGNDYLRAAIEATVNAALVNGWIIISDNEEEKKRVEGWINENEDDFYVFLRNLVTTCRIFGEAYVEVFAEPVPKVLDTHTVEVVRDEYGKVIEYVQHAQGRIVRFSPDEIVRINIHPLGTRAYGSPITATLRRTLEGQMYAELFVRDAFARRGVLSKAFILKGGTEEDFLALKEQINQSSPGSSLIVKGEIEIQDLGRPFNDLQVLDVLREYRQKIISVSGVPPILLGLEGGTNLETSRNQINAFVMMVKSLQRIISAGVTEIIKRKLNVKNIKFRLLEWTSPEQETRLHVMRVQAGIETINEARKALGLEELSHPIANVPLPLLTLAAQGGLVEFDLESMIADLLAQSARATPEKSFQKSLNIRKLEKKYVKELKSFFQRIINDDSSLPVLRQKYDAELRDIVRHYLTLAALEGIMYLDEKDVLPPMLGSAEKTVNKLLDVFIDDFWAVVADKKAGLIKPSKPIKNYSNLVLKANDDEEELEEELYPPQRLDYERRVELIATTSIWSALNGAIILALLDGKGEVEETVRLRWVTAGDEKVCQICNELDGREWGLEDIGTAGFLYPPVHPNCRCTLEVVS